MWLKTRQHGKPPHINETDPVASTQAATIQSDRVVTTDLPRRARARRVHTDEHGLYRGMRSITVTKRFRGLTFSHSGSMQSRCFYRESSTWPGARLGESLHSPSESSRCLSLRVSLRRPIRALLVPKGLQGPSPNEHVPR